MRKLLLYLCLFIGLTASAQESDLLQRIREANLKNTLRAEFKQVRHTQLLEENLTSTGFVALQAPDKVHWEVQKPVSRVTVFNGDIPQNNRRFRLPSEKDFTVSSLEGEELSVILKPRRRDLAQVFSQIVLKVDPKTLEVHSVLLSGLDGDWTSITFTKVQADVDLPQSLFEP